MKYVYILTVTAFLMMVLCVTSCTQCENNKAEQYVENIEELNNAAMYNVKRAYGIVDDIFPFIALIEGDHGEGNPYYDSSARWTVWYGTTIKPDGSRVKKTDPWIPRSEGRRYSYEHLYNHVFPFLKYFNMRKLSDEQIYCTVMFIYNVGGENVTGYNAEGKKVGNPSRYLEAVNSGKSPEYCVNCLTGFRRSGGKRAGGLLKRHWVEGAAYLGILTPENVLKLIPTQFYQTKNYGNYFWLDKRRRMIKEDDLYKLRYDETTIQTFFRMNTAGENDKSVYDII